MLAGPCLCHSLEQHPSFEVTAENLCWRKMRKAFGWAEDTREFLALVLLAVPLTRDKRGDTRSEVPVTKPTRPPGARVVLVAVQKCPWFL